MALAAKASFRRKVYSLVCLCTLLFGCSSDKPSVEDVKSSAVSLNYEFVTDVPQVQEPMLSSSYWIGKISERAERLTALEVSQFNQRSFVFDYSFSHFI